MMKQIQLAYDLSKETGTFIMIYKNMKAMVRLHKLRLYRYYSMDTPPEL